MSVAKDFGQLSGHRIRHAGLVGCRKERRPNGAAPHADLRCQRCGLDRGVQAGLAPFDAQAGEARADLVCVGCRVTRDQLVELAVRIDADLHHLAAAAIENLAPDRVGAQEGGRLRIVDRETPQQRVGRVAGASQVVAIQLEIVVSERLQLGCDTVLHDLFGDHPARQVGRVRHQWCKSERGGAKAGQGKTDRRGDLARVAGDEMSGLRGDGVERAIYRIKRIQFWRSDRALCHSARDGRRVRRVDLHREGVH
jgi:hypothetical protein